MDAAPGEVLPAPVAAAIAAGAEARDRDRRLPADAIAALREAGLLAAPLPVASGGRGWGSEPAAAEPIRAALVAIGRADLVVGRLYEAHVNALRLVARRGDREALDRVAEDARAGHLFALWVTDPPADALSIGRDGALSGGKAFCSGAGLATRALVTAAAPDGRPRLLVVDAGAARINESGFALTGMRGSGTGAADLGGLRALARIGGADDYLREPDFSTGAWRGSAVAAGGLLALADHAAAQLRARGRDRDPAQAARLGEMLIAAETASLWVRRAARAGEDADFDPRGAIARVGLARIAVETACLDGIRLCQRSLGLPAFIAPNPVERIMRDLATYLRQPAGDQVLAEAAALGLAAIGAEALA